MFLEPHWLHFIRCHRMSCSVVTPAIALIYFVLQDLPPAYMYFFGVIGYIIVLATMIYFTYTIYQVQTTKRFIALSHGKATWYRVHTVASKCLMLATVFNISKIFLFLRSSLLLRYSRWQL